ncbi:MAG: SRPBCC domain-containing protein [Candidatus Acidiferrum sp.]
MKVFVWNAIGRILASTIVMAAVLALSVPITAAQEVRNTSYVNKSGERVLRIETIVPGSTEDVWQAWTTPQELGRWIAPVVAIDLKIGGAISTNYDQKAVMGAAGTIRLLIINYIGKQLVTLKVNLNEKFPKITRDGDQNLQEIVQIVDLGDGRTKVVSSMVGWGTGKDWDQTYNFFARGNEWTYRQLAKYLSSLTPVTSSAPVVDVSHQQVVKIVTQIQRADYEGDRAALKRLYNELAPIPEDKKLASRMLYWRGFALWRRAANGFNDTSDPKEIGEDLEQAVNEFNDAIARDPGFVDAEAGAASCLNSLIFLNQKDSVRVQELAAKAGPLIKRAEAASPDNPRLLWVLGSIRWYVPPERGGGQDKSLAAQEKGLEAVREHKEDASDPLEPTWGEPELLMSLAWSNLNRTTPDLKAAEQYAKAALKLVPYWHYVRDILMAQIRAAQAKAVQG